MKDITVIQLSMEFTSYALWNRYKINMKLKYCTVFLRSFRKLS